MTTPPLDLPAARKIAEEAAYDAPWTYKQGFKTGGARVANTSGFDLPGCFNCGENDGVYEETTARHIAAFDPPTVLALLDRAEAAEKKVAAVREALEAHPKACDRRTEDDPIKCGWKRAVADVTRALDGTPYRTLSIEPLVSDHHTPETETTP